MNENFLPGLTKIAYCRADMLQPDSLDVIDESKQLKVYGAFTPLQIVELASMSAGSEVVNGNTIYNVKIACKIFETDDVAKALCRELTKNNYVYKCENVEGMKLLIGTDKKPYPIVTCTYNNDNVSNGKRGWNIEINYSNIHSYIVLQ